MHTYTRKQRQSSPFTFLSNSLFINHTQCMLPHRVIRLAARLRVAVYADGRPRRRRRRKLLVEVEHSAGGTDGADGAGIYSVTISVTLSAAILVLFVSRVSCAENPA